MKKNIIRFLLGFFLVGIVFLGNGEKVWAEDVCCHILNDNSYEIHSKDMCNSIGGVAEKDFSNCGVDIGKALKLKDGKGIAEVAEYENIGTFLSSTIIPNVMLAANLILFFMIFASGFTIISSAGNPDKQKQASQTLTASIIGFIIIFGAYWILEALNIITGFNFSILGN